MKAKRLLHKLIRIALFGLAAVLLIVVYCNWKIKRDTAPYLFDQSRQTPSNKVGLVLGTSRLRRDGSLNLYFRYRMQAAAELFKSGKIDFIIVSGDNSTKYYNEPADMRNELIRRGIPEAKIYLDYAGLRTLDSIIRCRDIFGQQTFTIISQPFHNERAIFIARHHGIQAVGYNAKDVEGKNSFKTQTRELFAKVKVFVDLYLLGKQPKHLGETIKIG